MDRGSASTRAERPAGASRSADPRPARTRAAILAAVERLPGLPAGQVTAAAIARDAGVSRSAFYTQFSGLEELLSAVLAEAAQLIGPQEGSSHLCSGFSSRGDMTRASLSRLVAHVDARATFYAAAPTWKIPWGVHDAALAAYAEQLRRLISAIRESALTDSSVPPPSETDLAAEFVAGGLLAALMAWIRTGRAAPTETLVEQLLGLMPGWLVSDETAVAGNGIQACEG